MKDARVQRARGTSQRRRPMALMLALGLVGALLPFTPASADHRCTVTTTPTRSVAERGSIQLSATATGCNEVNWDLDNDGAYDDATGTTATFSAGGMDGPGSRTVGVEGWALIQVCEYDPDLGRVVCLPEDDVSTDSTTVTINNVSPTGTFNLPNYGAAGQVPEGEPVALWFTNVTDVPADVAAGFAYRYRCPDLLWTGAVATATWWCGGVAADGPASKSVGGRITDKDGATVEYLRTLTISNVAPVASLVAPESVDEGTSVEISLTDGFDPSSVDTAAGFQYAFDCGEGFGESSPTSSASCATTDDEAMLVKAKIRDKDGGETVYGTTVTVNNVAPTADGLVAPAFVRAGRAFTVRLPGGTDVSTPDATSLTYAFDCGTGTFGEPSGSSSHSCRAGTAATAKLFRGKVIDKDGGETSYEDRVLVDGAKPTGKVTINRGARRTRTRRVTLKLRAKDPAPASGVAKMRFSNNGRKWSKWQRYATAKKWRLTRGKGTKTVYVQFQDRVGITSAKFKDRIRFRP